MSKTRAKNKISAKEIDKKFDDGKESVLDHFDKDTTVVRVLVDFPKWMLEILDKEATHLGIPRQAVIKTWLNEKIEAKLVGKSAS